VGARVIVADRSGRLLLFEGIDPAAPDVVFWFTPGGGVDPGETSEQAARRELLEETGLVVDELGEPVHEDVVEFGFDGVRYRQQQQYFAVRVDGDGEGLEIDDADWTPDEVTAIRRHRWWTPAELQATTEPVYPERLEDLVASVSRWGRARRA
jgi:8-oxo-dGTP pyrophosphatase MutT (NUDIX family)